MEKDNKSTSNRPYFKMLICYSTVFLVANILSIVYINMSYGELNSIHFKDLNILGISKSFTLIGHNLCLVIYIQFKRVQNVIMMIKLLYLYLG